MGCKQSGKVAEPVTVNNDDVQEAQQALSKVGIDYESPDPFNMKERYQKNHVRVQFDARHPISEIEFATE